MEYRVQGTNRMYLYRRSIEGKEGTDCREVGGVGTGDGREAATVVHSVAAHMCDVSKALASSRVPDSSLAPLAIRIGRGGHGGRWKASSEYSVLWVATEYYS